MHPRSDRQRSGVLARFGMKALVAALLLAPALSLGLAEPIADIANAKKHSRGGGGGVSTEDFAAPQFGSTITINDNSDATPYGSTVDVSGLNGTVVDINLILRNFSHDRPEDVAVMLEHQGRSAVVMRMAGTNSALRNANIVLDSDADDPLPNNSTIISNFPYEPQDFDPADTPFGGEAPDNGDGDNTPREYLNFFDGVTANGDWTLWVRDDAAPISGALGGWRLEIVTSDNLPFIAIDSYKTKQGRKLHVSANEGVLRSDPDKGEGHLSADNVSGTGPRKGKLNFHSDGSFTYKPKGNKKGKDSFEYVIRDELGAEIDGNGLVEIKIKKDKKHKKHKGKNKKRRNRR